MSETIETAWLIEHAGFYWCAGDGSGGAHDAVRFARREDAERTAKWLELSLGYSIVEHSWS